MLTLSNSCQTLKNDQKLAHNHYLDEEGKLGIFRKKCYAFKSSFLVELGVSTSSLSTEEIANSWYKVMQLFNSCWLFFKSLKNYSTLALTILPEGLSDRHWSLYMIGHFSMESCLLANIKTCSITQFYSMFRTCILRCLCGTLEPLGTIVSTGYWNLIML